MQVTSRGVDGGRSRRELPADGTLPAAPRGYGRIARAAIIYGRLDDLSTVVERRHVTALVADMAGFTAFTEQAGEEGAYSLMRTLRGLMGAAVLEHGGRVKEFTGDGLIALFGAPARSENAALNACRAAISMQQSLAAWAPQLQANHGVQPRLRIGISAGPVVIGRSDAGTRFAAFGDTLNFASHLQAVAEPGAVLLSESAWRLVQGLVECRFGGWRKIKGKATPQPVYCLDAIRRGAARFELALSRGLSTFVGRARELAALERRFVGSKALVRVIDVVGEPGIGKSRLIHEFCTRLKRSDLVILSGNCAQDARHTPLLPLIEVMRGAFGLRPDDTEAEVAHKLERRLLGIGCFSLQNLGLLLNLLGLGIPRNALMDMDDALIGIRTRELVQELLQAICSLSPVLLILEDMQWIDDASEELLLRLVQSERPLRLSIVQARRPEYRPPWADQVETAELRLKPLAATATAAIACERLGAEGPPDALALSIADRAEGNPLFAEELASFVLERGIARPFAGTIDAAALPASLQSVLTARIDRLAPSDRALLQAASVIGRRFAVDLLAAVVPSAAALGARLAAMVRMDLLHPDGASGEFAFKHGLVRDALYESLLSKPRAALHLRIAEEIERRSGTRITDVAETLAHHYAATEAADKAFKYLAMAGDKSFRSYSLDDADRYFAEALSLAERFPSCADGMAVGELVVAYLKLLDLRSKLPEMTRLAERWISSVEGLPDRRLLALTLHLYSCALFARMRLPEALPVARRAFALAEALGDDRALGYTLSGLALMETVVGSQAPEEAERMALRAAELGARTDDAFLAVASMARLAWHYVCRGLLIEGREVGQRLLEIGRTKKDTRASACGLWLLGWIAVVEGRYEDALLCARDSLAQAPTELDVIASTSIEGIALTLLRRTDAAVAKLDIAARMCLAVDNRYALSLIDSTLGLGMVLRGEVAGGLRRIERSAREAGGAPVFADWTRLNLAELYLELRQSQDRGPHPGKLGFLAWVKLVGARRALALAGEVLRNETVSEGGFMRARAHLVAALAEKARNRTDSARHHLSAARSIAGALGSSRISAKIDLLHQDIGHG